MMVIIRFKMIPDEHISTFYNGYNFSKWNETFLERILDFMNRKVKTDVLVHNTMPFIETAKKRFWSSSLQLSCNYTKKMGIFNNLK